MWACRIADRWQNSLTFPRAAGSLGGYSLLPRWVYALSSPQMKKTPDPFFKTERPPGLAREGVGIVGAPSIVSEGGRGLCSPRFH